MAAVRVRSLYRFARVKNFQNMRSTSSFGNDEGATAPAVLLGMLGTNLQATSPAWSHQGPEFQQTMAPIEASARICQPHGMNQTTCMPGGLSALYAGAENQLNRFDQLMSRGEAKVRDYQAVKNTLLCDLTGHKPSELDESNPLLQKLNLGISKAFVLSADKKQVAQNVMLEARLNAIVDSARCPIRPAELRPNETTVDRPSKKELEALSASLRQDLLKDSSGLGAAFVADYISPEAADEEELGEYFSYSNLDIFKSVFGLDDQLVAGKDYPLEWEGKDSDVAQFAQALGTLRTVENQMRDYNLWPTRGIKGLQKNGCIQTEPGFEDCGFQVYANLAHHLLRNTDDLFNTVQSGIQDHAVCAKAETVLPAAKLKLQLQLVRTAQRFITRLWDRSRTVAYKRLWNKEIGSLDLCPDYVATDTYKQDLISENLKVHPGAAVQLMLIDQYLAWKIPRLTEFMERTRTPEDFARFQKIIQQLDPISPEDPYHTDGPDRLPLGDNEQVNQIIETCMGLLPADMHESPIDKPFNFITVFLDIGNAACLRKKILLEGQNPHHADAWIEKLGVTSDRSVHAPAFIKPPPQDGFTSISKNDTQALKNRPIRNPAEIPWHPISGAVCCPPSLAERAKIFSN